MTLAEALDIAVARTGHARFRELLDPSHPDYEPSYEAVVRALAEGGTPGEARDGSGIAVRCPGSESDPAPTTPPPAPAFAPRLAAVKACPHWSRPSCGCQFGACAASKGDAAGFVSFDQCCRCLGV